mgnify:CR=1 FL=1
MPELRYIEFLYIRHFMPIYTMHILSIDRVRVHLTVHKPYVEISIVHWDEVI